MYVCNKLESLILGGEISRTDGFLPCKNALSEPDLGLCLSATT